MIKSTALAVLWFITGCMVGLVFVELALNLLYCMPRAASRMIRRASSKGLLLLFIRAIAYRCIAILALFLCIREWGFSYDRPLALGMSIVLSAYAIYTFTDKGRASLCTTFDRQASRFPPT